MKQETKEKAAKLWDDVKSGLKSGFNATKKGLKSAGSAIQNYSDLSVVAMEKKQFESKRKKDYTALGELVASKLSAKSAKPLSAEDEELSPILKEIASFNREISKREKILKDSEKKDSKADEKKAGAKKSDSKKTASSKGAAEKKTTAKK